MYKRVIQLYATFRHGTSERVYRIEFISNQDFTDSEFFKWKETMMINGLTLPSTDEVQKKLKELQAAHQYKFKDEDIGAVRGSLCYIDSELCF